MAKDIFSAKIEKETKEELVDLTNLYLEQGLIQEKGDLLSIAARLLERNLVNTSPQMTSNFEELDQLLARVNRIFLHVFEQSQTAETFLKNRYDTDMQAAQEKAEKIAAKLMAVEEQLQKKEEEILSLYGEVTKYQEEFEKGRTALLEKNNYILMLEKEKEANAALLAEAVIIKKRTNSLPVNMLNCGILSAN